LDSCRPIFNASRFPIPRVNQLKKLRHANSGHRENATIRAATRKQRRTSAELF
jgi:hypothetical protein